MLSELGDSAVNWKVRMWVATADFFPMTEALTGEIKQQLDAAISAFRIHSSMFTSTEWTDRKCLLPQMIVANVHVYARCDVTVPLMAAILTLRTLRNRGSETT